MPFIQFQLRRGTSTEWSNSNPVLAAGEIGIEIDTNLFKLGNGSSTWNNLSYGGIQGIQGIGIQGFTGAQGIQGIQGVGIQGIQGIGTQGTQGVTGSGGGLNWSNDLYNPNAVISLPYTQGITDFTLGYLDLPQNLRNDSYTLRLSDAGKHLLHPSSDNIARTWIIPQTGTSLGRVNWPLGTTITFINQYGAGNITIQVTGDTLRQAVTGNTGDRTLSQNGIATCIKVSNTEWFISGVNLT